MTEHTVMCSQEFCFLPLPKWYDLTYLSSPLTNGSLFSLNMFLFFSIWRKLTLLALETAFLWPFFHFNIPLLERLGAAFLSKKVEILIFCFLFFFSSSRPVITFNCQKSAFLVPTQGTSKLFSEKYYWIFRFRTPELSSKFLFFLNFESFFCPALSSNFEMSNCRKLNF